MSRPCIVPGATDAATLDATIDMPRFPNPLPTIQQTWEYVAQSSTPASRAAETVRPVRT